MNNDLPTAKPTVKTIRTKSGRAVTLKYLSAPQSSRKSESVEITNEIAREHATESAVEGFTVVGGEGTRLKAVMPENLYTSDARPLNISTILRPVVLAKKMTALPAMASVAAARAIESISDLKINVLWSNDLCCKNKLIATVRADMSILGDNFVDYIVLGISFNIKPDQFTPRLSDIVAAVFNNQSHDAAERLTEAFLNEFFTLYENYNDRSFMKEYKARCPLIGRQVKVPRPKGRTISARVCDIDNDACLIVETKSGERIPIYSRAGVIFK